MLCISLMDVYFLRIEDYGAIITLRLEDAAADSCRAC